MPVGGMLGSGVHAGRFIVRATREVPTGTIRVAYSIGGMRATSGSEATSKWPSMRFKQQKKESLELMMKAVKEFSISLPSHVCLPLGMCSAVCAGCMIRCLLQINNLLATHGKIESSICITVLGSQFSVWFNICCCFVF